MTFPADARAAPRLSVREVRAYLRRAPLRMPFQFGRCVMREQSTLYLRVRVEARGGRSARGVGAAALAPQWFDKRAQRPLEQRRRDLLLSAGIASDVYRDVGRASALELHERARGVLARRAAAAGLADLPASYGSALLDGAIVDALCRLEGCTFHAALRADLLGLGSRFLRWIPTRPRRTIAIRHTVGLLDPLRAQDLAAPLGDGLPETLEEVIRAYGVRWFKVKISGDVDASIERLARIAEVLEREAGGFRMTLDGNESFTDLEGLERFVAAAAGDARLREVWARTLWIEQPLEREAAWRAEVAAPLRAIAASKPVILDESDGSDGAAERALALGYGGVSAKYCKGLFRTLHSLGAIGEWNARGGPPAVLSAEDLTAPPLTPFHQDTCIVAALGIAHAERNGHHYLRGLSSLSAAEQSEALRRFPSLYQRRPGGLVALAIRAGRIDLGEINRVGLGIDSEPPWPSLEAVELPREAL